MDFNKDAWRPVVHAALSKAIADARGPTTGAKLRALLGTAAKENGLSYPPEEVPKIRFRDFIDAFSDIAVTLVRPSQDFLVAPADHPEMLVDHEVRPGKELPGIRRDIFDAFTRIDDQNSPWYDVHSKSVHWLSNDSKPPVGCVQFLKRTEYLLPAQIFRGNL